MNPKTLIALSLLSSLPIQAATYTWLGTANDGDWNNAANWNGNLVSVDSDAGQAGLSFSNTTDKIVFNGPAPTTNTPDIGGHNLDGTTPTLEFNQGGTYNMSLASSAGVWSYPTGDRTVFTVGDGLGTTKSDVVLNLSLGTNAALNRHSRHMRATYLVDSDATLNFDTSLLSLTYNTDSRYTTINLAGGDATIDGFLRHSINATVSEGDANYGEDSYILFSEAGSSFTANYGGGDFADFAAVQADADNLFRADSGLELNVIDNGNNSFTITSAAAVPEASSSVLLGLGGLLLGLKRRR